MIDITKIRTDTAAVEAALNKRLPDAHQRLMDVIALDDQRRALVGSVSAQRAILNQASKTKPDTAAIARLKKLGDEIKTLEDTLTPIETALESALAELPNLPADDVVAGDKDQNRVLKVYGKKKSTDGANHVDLAESLDLIDYQRGTKIAGNGFWVYRGDGALLEWALLNYCIDFHRRNKYTFILPPYLLTEQSAYTSGHLPKFRDDLYWTQDGLCLNATSEMMLGNYHRDEILAEEGLPLKYFAYSACFRREAGSYRREERGMVRGHQFNKIEMFQLTTPETSWSAFDELLEYAVKLVDGLGLHFQTVQLAAGDIASAMAKTVDIEVWIPSMGIYKEVSSVSNALDYQARRGGIRFRRSTEDKPQYVHTLNASGLATSRLIPAILEQFQNADGSVTVPKALHKYCGFKKLEKKKARRGV